MRRSPDRRWVTSPLELTQLKPGRYLLQTGIYDSAAGQRLNVSGEDGNEVTLALLEIGELSSTTPTEPKCKAEGELLICSLGLRR